MMKYKLLASDFDNTLVPFGEGCPRAEVAAAIQKARQAGMKFAISTGRSFPAIRHPALMNGISFDYAITCNGAYVTDGAGNVMSEHPLTSEEMYALVDFCEDYNYPLEFAFRDAYYAYTEYELLNALYSKMPGSYLTVLDGEDQDRHLIDMPHAAFLIFPHDGLARFSEKYGHLNLHFMQVGNENADGMCTYDVVRGGVDKATGLCDLCAVLDIPVAEAVAAGDSANDCGMLKAAGLGCAMANATEGAKAAADRVIGDVRENGLAALVEELWFDGPAAVPSGRDFGPAWAAAL